MSCTATVKIFQFRIMKNDRFQKNTLFKRWLENWKSRWNLLHTHTHTHTWTQSHVYNRTVTRNYNIHIKPLCVVPVKLLLKEGFTRSQEPGSCMNSKPWHSTSFINLSQSVSSLVEKGTAIKSAQEGCDEDAEGLYALCFDCPAS